MKTYTLNNEGMHHLEDMLIKYSKHTVNTAMLSAYANDVEQSANDGDMPPMCEIRAKDSLNGVPVVIRFNHVELMFNSEDIEE